jgi:integrase
VVPPGALTVRRSKAKRVRVVPLSDPARAVLAGLLETRPAVPMTGPASVLPGISHDRLTRGVAKAASRAGLVAVTCHTLRHGFASRAAAAGVDLGLVGRLLGHARGSVAVTQRHAAWRPEGAEREAIRRMDAARVECEAGGKAVGTDA